MKEATKLARDIVRKTHELNDLLFKAAQMGLLVQIEQSKETEMGEIKGGTILSAPRPYTNLSIHVYVALDRAMTRKERKNSNLDAALD